MESKFTGAEKRMFLQLDLQARFTSWSIMINHCLGNEAFFLENEIFFCKEKLQKLKEKVIEENKNIIYNKSFFLLTAWEQIIEHTKISIAENRLRSLRKLSGENITWPSQNLRFKKWFKNISTPFTTEEEFYEKELSLAKSSFNQKQLNYYTSQLLDILQAEYDAIRFLRLDSIRIEKSGKTLMEVLDLKKNVRSLNLGDYAMMHYYIDSVEGKKMKIQEANVLARDYKFNSGRNFLNTYNDFKKKELHIGKNRTNKTNNIMKRFTKILPLLEVKNVKAHEKANLDFQRLVAEYDALYHSTK